MSNVISNLFKSKKIAPDIIESVSENILPLEVEYGDLKVNGTELTPTQVKDKPKVSWNTEMNALYTLIFTDPDAGFTANFLHWMVVNIPENKIENGHIAFDYIGSGPPKWSGIHRYTFLVYRQKQKLKELPTVSRTSISGRLFFNPSKYASQNELEGPIAGNILNTTNMSRVYIGALSALAIFWQEVERFWGNYSVVDEIVKKV